MRFPLTGTRADPAGRLSLCAMGCSVAIALPFLFPLAAGPSVNAWQQLVSWLCVASLLLLIKPAASARRPVATIGVAVSATLIALSCRQELGIGTSLAAAVVVAAMGLAACAGAQLARHGDARFQGAVAWGIFAAGIISAMLGLLQYQGLAKDLGPWIASATTGQAFGNLRQRNQFASLISMALIAAFWLYAVWPPRTKGLRGAWTGAVVLLVFASAASTSRTGLVQFLSIAGMTALMACRERRRPNNALLPRAARRLPAPWLILSLVPLYAAAAWLLPLLIGGGGQGMLHRLSENIPPTHSRVALWRNVVALIAERPWGGWGWGELSFAHYTHSALYEGPRFVTILDNAHNLPLHLAVELGIPAAVLLCGGFLCLVFMARPWREREPLRLLAWGLLGVILLHSLLEYPLWYGPFQLVFGFCIGILWPSTRCRAPIEVRRWRHGFSSVSAALLIAAVGYAGWDYLRISQVYVPRDQRWEAYKDDTLAKLQGSWLFANQVRFAKFTLTTVTTDNAAEMHALSGHVLHFSPEPRVIVKRIESAQLLGLNEEARTEAERFRIAFPSAYERWRKDPAVDSPEP